MESYVSLISSLKKNIEYLKVAIKASIIPEEESGMIDV